MSGKILRALLTAIGSVAVVVGTISVMLGADQVMGDGLVTANLDSEYRFYSVWYVVAGILLLRAARHIGSEGFVIRLVAGGFLAAGIFRVVSIVSVGRPDALYLVLMAAEFAIGIVVIPWVTMLERRGLRASPQKQDRSFFIGNIERIGLRVETKAGSVLEQDVPCDHSASL